jgi:hypothetical protein
VGQVVLALILTVVSVLVLVPVHRLSLDVAGVAVPAGLVFAVLFQIVASVFLWASTGSRLPILLLGCLWGLAVIPFAGSGAGGGALLPAALGEQLQVSSYLIQGIGVLVPLLVALVITLVGRRKR